MGMCCVSNNFQMTLFDGFSDYLWNESRIMQIWQAVFLPQMTGKHPSGPQEKDLISTYEVYLYVNISFIVEVWD